MIACFGSKVADGVLVEIPLEVVTGAPQVVFGDAAAVSSCTTGKGFFIHVRRGGQIGSGVVQGTDGFRQHLSGQRIGVGITVFAAPAVGQVAFVIPCPQHDGGMVTQHSDDSTGFLVQRSLEPVILGIDGTGHGKILPYHYAVCIAVIVEILVFVYVTAPAADDVASKIRHHGHDFRQSFLISGVVCIHRYPVGTHGENLFAVDDEAEFAVSVLVGHAGTIQLNGTKPGLPAPCMHQLTLAVQFSHHIVQVGIAVIVRPPQLGIVNGRGCVAAGVPQGNGPAEGGIAAGTGYLQGVIPDVACGNAAVVYHLDKGVGTVHRVGLQENILDAAFGKTVDVYVLPDPCGYGTGHDIPAVLGSRLADVKGVRIVLHAVGIGVDFVFSGFDHGRGEVHYHFVLAVCQLGQIKGNGHKHIVAFCHQFSVDIYLGKAVQPFKYHNVIQRRIGFVGEGAVIELMHGFIGIELVDILFPENLRHHAGSFQIQFKIAGYLRRDYGKICSFNGSYGGEGGVNFAVLTVGKRPVAVQREDGVGFLDHDTVLSCLCMKICDFVTSKYNGIWGKCQENLQNFDGKELHLPYLPCIIWIRKLFLFPGQTIHE